MQADGAEPVSGPAEPGLGQEGRPAPEAPAAPGARAAAETDPRVVPDPRLEPGGTARTARPPEPPDGTPPKQPAGRQGAAHSNAVTGSARLTGTSIQAQDVQKIVVNNPPPAPQPPPAAGRPPDDTALVMRVEIGGEVIEFFDESVARIFINIRWGQGQ